MPKKDPSGSPLTQLVPILQAAGWATAVLTTWAIFEPLSFATQVLPVARAIGAGTLAATGAYALAWRPLPPLRQTHEDYACGWYITGLPGSGKTAFAILMVREFCRRSWGWIWLSIKSSLSLLQYLPEEARARCILFAPYAEHPRGLNFLRCYTGTATERELLSDQTAELFSRLHPHMSAGMRELIRMGALALLQWAHREQLEVTLWELYMVFQSQALRVRVLAGAPKPIRDAFGADEARKQTLQAVRAQLRRSVTSENLLVALSQRGGIDLWDVIEQERWLVCDTPTDVLGPGVSAFLCQVVASRVQMLTFRRTAGARPFACFADEFQRYTNPSFAQGLETGREYGLAWFLIHQTNAGQELGREVHGAVGLCGNQVYFTQEPDKDARRAARALGGRWTEEQIAELPKRHYRARRRLQGRPVYEAGVTADLPAPDPALAEAIIRRAAAGPSRAEILREIQKRKPGSGVSAELAAGQGESENETS